MYFCMISAGRFATNVPDGGCVTFKFTCNVKACSGRAEVRRQSGTSSAGPVSTTVVPRNNLAPQPASKNTARNTAGGGGDDDKEDDINQGADVSDGHHTQDNQSGKVAGKGKTEGPLQAQVDMANEVVSDDAGVRHVYNGCACKCYDCL